MTIRNFVFGALLAVALPFTAQAESTDLNSLLNLVEKGQARDNQEFNQRLSEFKSSKAEQEKLLADAVSERTRLEALSSSKEEEFRINEQKIADAQERLNERLGGLKELFGVLQQVAGDSKAVFEGSVVSSQVADRDEFLTDLIRVAGATSELPSIEQLERLWFEMQREATLSGAVAQYQADVVVPSGETVSREVTRVGGFNVVSEGVYLNWDLETGRLVELDKQPGGRYLTGVAELEASTGALTGFWVDPSKGQLLRILGQTPELGDRVEQGAEIGYIILGLAVIGILLSIVLIIKLMIEKGRVSKQMKSDTADEGNSLGRVMAVFNANKNSDTETLELHLGEAISAEVPKLTRGIGWIKLISVVAPLLGLLGTVTGMIDVFETMSLFGTGDPKLMAGGISQALVTTVLGLVAAIPCVFLHTLTNNISRSLILILEERATGILARQSEQKEAA